MLACGSDNPSGKRFCWDCGAALARLAAWSCDAAFDGALRQARSPYHFPHGLLDHAEYLVKTGDQDGAAAPVAEASAFAQDLRCQPLIDRASELVAPLAPFGRSQSSV
jgi:hypothetical protein